MLATESATLTFLLAMAKFPEIQRRAQAEVDGLTEGKRLPTMADRPNLPFVDAVLSEVLRWVSIAPVSKYPHSSVALATELIAPQQSHARQLRTMCITGT